MNIEENPWKYGDKPWKKIPVKDPLKDEEDYGQFNIGTNINYEKESKVNWPSSLKVKH